VALDSGTRLGPYEVVGPLGAGGMGEVYRARDTGLKREVALKVLPAAFTTDVDRLTRFQREAELLATLNHPHIAAIYGLHRDAATTALVLELVEGDTLADRIARGPLPIDDAVRIALQIAAALEAAHERGIVHRDLKPANVKIRPDGTVKVLDFGLAKALDPAAPASASLSPTITSPAMTHAGVILGTAAYMSPEQARGQAADARSDIWAFGCVLVEMLTGEKAFQGDSVPEALASVLRSEPLWSKLPADTSPAIRRLLRRCLRKDRTRRLADIRDARLELEEPEEAISVQASAAPSRTRERLFWSAALAVMVVGIVGLATSQSRERVPTPDHSYFDLPTTTDPTSFALSPDGRQVVFVASLEGRPQLWHYSFDTGERRALRGTADASYPFWSPDGRSIGFFTNERLYRLTIDGGNPRGLAIAPLGTGGTWNRDGILLYTPVPDAQAMRVSESEGEPEGTPPGLPVRLPQPDKSVPGGERFPQFLPDGRHFIYYRIESRQVFVGSIDSAERTVLVDGADAAAVVAPPDRVLFIRGGALLIQRLDLATRRLIGEATQISRDVAIDARGIPALSVSAEGTLLFRSGSGNQPRRLVAVDRNGTTRRDIARPDPSFPINPDLCPGAKRVVLNRTISGNTGIDEIDLDRGIPTTLTTSPLPEIVPVCTARGVTFAALGASGIVRLEAGNQTALVKANSTQGALIPLDEAPNGTLLYRTLGIGTGWNIHAVEPQRAPRALLEAPWDERGAQFSPDGKWFAYESNERDGIFEILVQSYPPTGLKKYVTSGGGTQPRWEGDEIFYVSADGYLTAVRAVPADGQDIHLGPPERLFAAQIESTVQGGIGHAYAVFPGGKEFLLSTFTELPAQPLRLIRNLIPAP